MGSPPPVAMPLEEGAVGGGQDAGQLQCPVEQHSHDPLAGGGKAGDGSNDG